MSGARDLRNLDEVCRIESTCVFPLCGQEIEAKFLPQELFRNGIEMPPHVARTVIRAYVQDFRFRCHNWCSQHCFWAIFWILLSSLLWTGVVLLISADSYDYADYSSRSSGNYPYRHQDDGVFAFGMGFVISYLGLLAIHIIGCVVCRRWRRPAVHGKLAQLNGCTTQYNCLATVVNSRYGTAFHLVFYYYNIDACVKELAARLLQRMFGDYGTVPMSPTEGQRTEQQRCQDEAYARSLVVSYSPEYLLKFVEGRLDEVTSQKHTLQGCCLCQYVEMKLAATPPHRQVLFPSVVEPPYTVLQPIAHAPQFTELGSVRVV